MGPILQPSDENRAPENEDRFLQDKLDTHEKKEEKKMTNSFTTIYTIITKAAAEAGIRDNENYKVRIISKDSDILEFELETEWTMTTCYADMESSQILGLMTENKSLEKLLDGTIDVRKTHRTPPKAA